MAARNVVLPNSAQDRLTSNLLRQQQKQTAHETESVYAASRVNTSIGDSESEQQWMKWPYNLTTYAPDIDYGSDVHDALRELESDLLSDDTAVQYLSASRSKSDIEDRELDIKALTEEMQSPEEKSFKFFFINRFLIKAKKTRAPADAKKLRISGPALRMLLSRLDAPPTFVGSFSRYYQPAGRGCRRTFHPKKQGSFEFWYILPVRVQVECTDLVKKHASTTAGSNQMDPFHYLHLDDEKLDIRGSQVGVLFQYDALKRTATTISVSFQDGRWSRVVEEPRRRIRETMERFGIDECEEDPFFMHLVYLTSTLRWWKNALDSFNNQLIAHEKRLQEGMGAQEPIIGDLNTETSRALHTMTAHLHRYGSELGWFQETVADLAEHHSFFFRDQANHNVNLKESAGERISLGIIQVASQLKAVDSFRRELENKVQNILALLFNNIQVLNDKMVVANGEAMTKILRAARIEAKISRRLADQSQKIALEMKEDSVAMKTIAILTMFFLPGTSFAAILATPFFSQNEWLNDARRIWVWIILTVPSTVLAFIFYAYWKRRQWSKEPRKDAENGTVRMTSISVIADSEDED